MTQETFIVGGREYTAFRMNAFAANKLVLRLQKIILPIFGAALGGQKLGDMDVKQAAAMIAEHVDETVMDSIVLPLFAESRVFDTEREKAIKTAADIDVCFTSENLFDLYELIFEIGRWQFGPFFVQLMTRIGDPLADKAQTKPSQDK